MSNKRWTIVATAVALSLGVAGAAAAQAKHVDGHRQHRTHHRPAAMPRDVVATQPPSAGQLSAANQDDAGGPGAVPQRRNWGACGIGHWGTECRR